MNLTVPTFKTVLCAVDFSSHAKAALYLSAGLTFERGARLVVLLVDDRASGGERERLAARVQLDTFVRETVPGSSSYSESLDLEVLAGPPAETILAMAAQVDAELVVVGTRGRGAFSRALFGSTTGALLRTTRVPLAIVPPTDPELVSIDETQALPHLGLILVPIDTQRPVSRQMLFAARLSPGSGHHLLLMHVASTKEGLAPASSRLEALAREVPSARGWRTLAKVGAVNEEVLAIAQRERVGIVVLGKSSVTPGKLAYELLRRGGAVVVVVP